MELDLLTCDRARLSRDARFDGRFFIAITTTKIYCRPICPSPRAKYAHVRYFLTASAAQAAGFRPCMRCRPEAAPGTPAWSGTTGIVSRALRLIHEGALDREDVEAFSDHLGVTGRHLRRLFLEHLGSTPSQIAATRRLHFAKKLLDETSLPIQAVAEASGFGSVRSFNQQIRKTYARTPVEIRKMARRKDTATLGSYLFRLAYRPPFHWKAMHGFLRAGAIPGVESVRDGKYRRTIVAQGKTGVLEVSHSAAAPELSLLVQIPESRSLLSIVEKTRRMFDMAADPATIEEHLSLDPCLREQIVLNPGIRVPGAWDGFEVAVLAILGQRTAPSQAAAMAGRLADKYGAPVQDTAGLARTFPSAAVLASADLESTGIAPGQAKSIRAAASGGADGWLPRTTCIDASAGLHKFARIAEIDALTAEYIAMRVLGDPDAFPVEDCEVPKGSRPQQWRPWRAYAAMLLNRRAVGSPHEKE